MEKQEISVVNCEIGSILIYTRNDICERIVLTNYFHEESEDNVFTLQIKEYLNGIRQELDFPVMYKTGTMFERIWKYLKENVSYGKIITYGELGKLCNTNPRVVGHAMASNPLPLYIPCHRVVAKNSIGGFSAGNNRDINTSITWKKYLLNLEGSL
ncbi:methylated-DNA--[protein]-cysteine S-methyltransferase [Fervidobacterium sp.]